jgi:hypothetical protein
VNFTGPGAWKARCGRQCSFFFFFSSSDFQLLDVYILTAVPLLAARTPSAPNGKMYSRLLQCKGVLGQELMNNNEIT